MRKEAIINALNGITARLKSWVENKFTNIRTNVISTPVKFTINTSAWTILTTAKGEYKYSATLSISNITSDDSINVIFDIDSLPICITAEIASTVETNNGNIKLYAKTIPTTNIAGIYIIIKG